MSEGWRGSTPEPTSSQRSEEPPASEGAGPSAAPGELAGLVTTEGQAAPAAQWSPQIPPPPAKKSSRWMGLALRVGIIAVIGIGVFIFRDRLTGAATDLRVGDCFDEPSTTATEVSDVQHQPCTEAHDGEIIYVADFAPQDAYPGEEAFEAYVLGYCVPAFESYIGRDYETDREFDFGFFYPTPEGWTESDHEISCYAFRVDGQKLTTSVKAAG